MTYRTKLERTAAGRWVAECDGPRAEIRAQGETLDAALDRLRREIRSQLNDVPSDTDQLVELEVHCVLPVHADGWSGV